MGFPLTPRPMTLDDLELHKFEFLVNFAGFRRFSELLPRGSPDSAMQSYLQDLHVWTTHNKMKINYSKTKEMILGR